MTNRMKTFLHLLCLFCLFAVCGAASAAEEELHVNSLLQCPEEDICSVASKCCVTGVDSYGWIAAAVGWSLWFLTLILFCVGKIMDLRPDEPKYLQA